ncbi:12742_t:CDS:1, partial [Dentiscutata erythropus]
RFLVCFRLIGLLGSLCLKLGKFAEVDNDVLLYLYWKYNSEIP